MITVYPHRTLAGDVTLRICKGKLDDGDFPKDPFVPDQRLADFYDIEKTDWKRITLSVEVAAPTEEVEEIDKEGGSVQALVTAKGASTNTRVSVPLTRVSAKSAQWTGTIELERETFSGKVELVAVLTATIKARPSKYLGTSEPWLLYFDVPDLPPLQGNLNVSWVDFENPPVETAFLKEYADEPFFTNLTSKVPWLHLNKAPAFQGFFALLEDRKRTDPRERALHDSERVGIVRSVWLAMFNASVDAIVKGEEGADPDWPTDDWKKSVLKTLLGRVYPHLSEPESLKQALEDSKSSDGSAQLQSWAEAAINAHIAAGKLLRKTLESLSMDDAAGR